MEPGKGERDSELVWELVLVRRSERRGDARRELQVEERWRDW